MFRIRTPLVIAALSTSALSIAPAAFADDPPDSHRPTDTMLQDRDPYDPLRDDGTQGNSPGNVPGATPGYRSDAPKTIERMRSGEPERTSQLDSGSYVSKFHRFMGMTLPLSPLLYPIDNDVTVTEWVESCYASAKGWSETTCYGGGLGGAKTTQAPAVSRTPDAS